MKKKTLLLLSFGLLLSCFSLQSQIKNQKRASTPLKHGSHRVGKRTDPAMQHWRDYGLGQFIHWGLYSIPGGHWDGQYFDENAESIIWWDHMPRKIYDNFYKEFNPTNFNATMWAKQAKDMGVKYMIFTTKHHEGFCMWPSQYTEYDIASTPFKRDIIGELVDAYTKEGIDIYFYYSLIDQVHRGNKDAIPSTPKEIEEFNSLKEYTRNQLIELMTKYPQVKGFWFDGSWPKAWINEAKFCDDLEKELKTINPNLIIGSRFRADEYGARHFDTNGDLIGDYDQGWERALPNSIDDINNNDWECVMTIPENNWGYHSDWRGYVKTSFDLIKMLMQTRSMGGNFVVNFGPDSKGNIRSEETKIAEDFSKWMAINKEAVYSTGYAGLKEQGWGYFTRKENKVYMSVFNTPINKMLKVEIPKGGDIPVKASILGTEGNIEIQNAGKDKFNNNLYNVIIPASYKIDKPFVIILDMRNNTTGSSEYKQAQT